jgi:hypothetical protein
MAIVWLEVLGKLKNLMTSSGIEPATFWIVTVYFIKLNDTLMGAILT